MFNTQDAKQQFFTPTLTKQAIIILATSPNPIYEIFIPATEPNGTPVLKQDGSQAVRPALLMMVMLPFWTSFLLRVYAWKGILADQGVLNQILMGVGIISEPIQMLYTNVSMLVGMTYVYLPFMVLPLYANLVKMDFRLLEAAYDLGTTPFKAFWLVTVPLSKAGIIQSRMTRSGGVSRAADKPVAPSAATVTL